MAFCTFCGKQLADGEVCSCQQAAPQAAPAQPVYTAAPQQTAPQAAQPVYTAPQQAAPAQPKGPSPFSKGFKTVGAFFKGVFKKPFDATEEFFDNANLVASGFFWLVLMIVYIFENIINTAMGYVLFENGSETRLLYMYDNSYSFLKGVIDNCYSTKAIYDVEFGSFVQAFFFPMLWMITVTAAVFGLGILINAIFVKGSFKKAIVKIGALCGVTAAGMTAIQIVAIMKNFIVVSGVNIFFTVIQSIIALFVVIQGLMCVKKLIKDKNKAFLAMMIMIAGVTIVSFLSELFFGYFAPYFIPLVF